MNKIFIYLIINILIIGNINAQIDTSRTLFLSIVPQYLIIDGIRVDFDMKLKKYERSWLQVCPQIYYSTENHFESVTDHKDLFGLGADINHRIYAKSNFRYASFYLAYGPVLKYYTCISDYYRETTVIENETEYIKYNKEDNRYHIFQTGFNVLLGLQIFTRKYLALDFYGGVGMRHSFLNSKRIVDEFNKGILDYGYKGTLIVGGVRFGMFL